MDVISSLANPVVKLIQKLDKKREREKSGTFLIEGIREIRLAAKSGIKVEHLLFNQKWNQNELDAYLKEINSNRNTILTNEVFAKVCYRDSVANALALCQLPNLSLSDLKFSPNALILILESIEKPGNLGAIFRTADAAGVDAVLIAEPNTDVLNPNTIRASLGALFTVPFISTNNDEVLSWLQNNQFNIVATWLEATMPHFQVEYQGNTAIVMGSEAFGISTFWQENAHKTVKIPMRGQVDSMNVSTATAVVVYEAIRQRMV